MTRPEPGARWRAWAQRCESALDQILPQAGTSPEPLHAAMRHAVLDGGKRMRPLLVYATGTAFGADEAALDSPAMAVELIHAYSLVHDDLPAMDDDSLRRGRPTVHVAFGEATAILAGDALQALAFETLAATDTSAASRVAMLHCLAVASGTRGMVGGQALDLAAVGRKLDIDQLRAMHACKTGALIRAAVRLGALAAGVDSQIHTRLDRFADALGLAFQIRDDVLDVEGDTTQIGKTRGKDAANSKPTYPSVLGIEGSRALLGKLAEDMDQSLQQLDADTAELAHLARFAVTRSF